MVHAKQTATIIVENTDSLDYELQDFMALNGFEMDYTEDYTTWAQGDIIVAEFLKCHFDYVDWDEAITFAESHGSINSSDEEDGFIMIDSFPF